MTTNLQHIRKPLFVQIYLTEEMKCLCYLQANKTHQQPSR